jgi:DNA repair exonuclease SbcCD ATPase subunit
MRTLKFHYLGLWNFMPFGPKGIEIHFEQLAKTVFVRGENRDVKPLDEQLPFEEIRVSSNGSGKSSNIDGLAWVLYGKTVKNPAKIRADDVINNLIGKNCKGVVIVDQYRIERGRKPNFLRLWESEKHVWDDTTEITQGDMRLTQKRIEEIIGLSYEAFINICVFSDQQESCFLECDAATKREIVENLLSLSVYRQRHETTQNELKVLKTSVKTLSREYEILLNNKVLADERIKKTLKNEADWKTARLHEIKQLLEQIKTKTNDLNNSNVGAALLAYQQAQEQIKEITPQIAEVEELLTQRQGKLNQAQEKEASIRQEAQLLTEQIQECQLLIKTKQAEIKAKEQFIQKLKNNEHGQRCSQCWGIIDENNSEHACFGAENEITEIKTVIETEMVKANGLLEQVKEVKAKQEKLRQIIQSGEKKNSEDNVKLKGLRNQLVTASQVREPKADSAELLLQQQIEELKERIKAKKLEADGPSPFVDILANDRLEAEQAEVICLAKEKEIKDAEYKIPYYEYWLKAYGDKGIRKWIIDGIIPALNDRIAYWLQFLIDNKISLKFDNELNELIERNPADGDPYVYHAMSAGQRRRLNLAVSQAFAHIMMLSTGTSPSLIFLDEVTTNVDLLGCIGIFNMIQELAQDKQVFVTTHEPELMKMLENSDILKLVHENGITTLED